MSYVIPIPIILIAALILLISIQFKLKIFSFICKIIIVLGILYFIYSYSTHLGFDWRTIIPFKF